MILIQTPAGQRKTPKTDHTLRKQHHQVQTHPQGNPARQNINCVKDDPSTEAELPVSFAGCAWRWIGERLPGPHESRSR